MKTLQFAFTSIVLFVAQAALGQDLLPTLSYWEMSFQLTRSSELCDALEVSLDQKKQVQAMRAEPAWSSVFDSFSASSRKDEDAKAKRLIEQVRNNKQLSEKEKKKQIEEIGFAKVSERISEPRYMSYTAANQQVKQRLAEILSEKQMAKIYPTMMRAKYGNGCSPFNDLAFKKYCKIPADWPSERDSQKIKQVEFQLSSKLLEGGNHACRMIIESLPDESQERMLSVVGSIKGMRQQSKSRDDIPTNPIASARIILDSPEIQLDIGLTSTQLDQLNKAENRYENEFQLLASKKQLRKDKWDELDASLEKEIKGCLDKQQLYLLQQFIHQRAFLNDLEPIRKPVSA